MSVAGTSAFSDTLRHQHPPLAACPPGLFSPEPAAQPGFPFQVPWCAGLRRLVAHRPSPTAPALLDALCCVLSIRACPLPAGPCRPKPKGSPIIHTASSTPLSQSASRRRSSAVSFAAWVGNTKHAPSSLISQNSFPPGSFSGPELASFPLKSYIECGHQHSMYPGWSRCAASPPWIGINSRVAVAL